MRRWIVTILIAGSPLHASALANPSPRFGIAVIGTDSTACLGLEGPRLTAGDTLLIAIPDSPIVTKAYVQNEIRGVCVEGRGVLSDSLSYYELGLHPQGDLEATLGVAVIALGASVTHRGGWDRIVIHGETLPYTFRICAGCEGLHFTVWQGAHRVWHRYYYVGFDLESDCTDEETGEP